MCIPSSFTVQYPKSKGNCGGFTLTHSWTPPQLLSHSPSLLFSVFRVQKQKSHHVFKALVAEKWHPLASVGLSGAVRNVQDLLVPLLSGNREMVNSGVWYLFLETACHTAVEYAVPVLFKCESFCLWMTAINSYSPFFVLVYYMLPMGLKFSSVGSRILCSIWKCPCRPKNMKTFQFFEDI